MLLVMVGIETNPGPANGTHKAGIEAKYVGCWFALIFLDLLALLRFSAKTAEVALKLMHDVETNPGPNCSGVGNF